MKLGQSSVSTGTKTSGRTRSMNLPDDAGDVEGIVDVNRRVGDQFPGHLLARLRARGKDDARPGEAGAQRRHDRGGRRHLADGDGMKPDSRRPPAAGRRSPGRCGRTWGPGSFGTCPSGASSPHRKERRKRPPQKEARYRVPTRTNPHLFGQRRKVLFGSEVSSFDLAAPEHERFSYPYQVRHGAARKKPIPHIPDFAVRDFPDIRECVFYLSLWKEEDPIKNRIQIPAFQHRITLGHFLSKKDL